MKEWKFKVGDYFIYTDGAEFVVGRIYKMNSHHNYASDMVFFFKPIYERGWIYDNAFGNKSLAYRHSKKVEEEDVLAYLI